jgi:lysozyme
MDEELLKRLQAVLEGRPAQADATRVAVPPPTPFVGPRREAPSTVQQALELVMRHEGFRGEAYRDPRGIPTIGYGSTGPDVRMGQRITEPAARQRAEDHIRTDSVRFERQGITPPAAALSASYNLGLRGVLDKLGMRGPLREGNWAAAADSLEKADKAGGGTLPGLTKRRQEEADLLRALPPRGLFR